MDIKFHNWAGFGEVLSYDKSEVTVLYLGDVCSCDITHGLITVKLPDLYKDRKDGTRDAMFFFLEPNGNSVNLVTSILNDKHARKDYRTVVRHSDKKPYAQVAIEALVSKHTKKHQRDGWCIVGQEAPLPEPMLLEEWEDYGPALLEKHGMLLLSPKLNGIRATFHMKNKKLISRKRNPFVLPKIEHALTCMAMSVDGELWHPDWTFEEICSVVKSQNINLERKEHLQFWIFDHVAEDVCEKSFVCRQRGILHRFTRLSPAFTEIIKVVPVVAVRTEEEVIKWRDRIIKQGGADGAVVRPVTMQYAFNTRSKECLKVKALLDAEFRIVDYTYDEDPAYGKLIVFVLETKDDQPFKYVPNWTKDVRSQAYVTRDDYVGKLVTLEFREYTTNGIPKHIKNIIGVRDYE